MDKLQNKYIPDHKVDFELVQQLEERIDSLRKLQNSISSNFGLLRKEFDEFLIETAGYVAKTINELPQAGTSGLAQRIEEKLSRVKPKGKVTLSVCAFDYSLIRDYEPEFKALLEPFQELFIVCDESMKSGDFKIESDNMDLKDIFEMNLVKLSALLGISYDHDSARGNYNFDNKEHISKRLSDLKYMNGFDILREINPVVIANIIKNEEPTTIAVILSRLSHEKSIEIISHLGREKISDTCEKIKGLNSVTNETIDEVESIIYRLFRNELYQTYLKKDGLSYLTELFRENKNYYSKMLLSGLVKNNPDLASKVSDTSVAFEDVIYIDDRGIQSLIKKVKRNELAASLINSPVEVLNKFLRNMSSGAVQMLYEELEALRDITEEEIENRRKYILRMIKEMEEKGELSSLKDGRENIFSNL